MLLAVGIAMTGWLLGLMLKSTAMIPFGPWLALGFVVALWLSKPAAALFQRYAQTLEAAWRSDPSVLALAGGLVLVATAVAVILARLVRRFVEPKV